QGMLDGLSALGVCHATVVLCGCLVDSGGDLFDGELWRGWRIGGGEDAARCCQFNPVGTGAQDLANCFTNLVDAIGDAIWHVGEADTKEANIGATGVEAVAVSARL